MSLTQHSTSEETWWYTYRDGAVVSDVTPRAIRFYRPRTGGPGGDSAMMGITLGDGRKTTHLQESSEWLYCRTEQEALDVKRKYEQSATTYADNEAVKTIRDHREELARMQAAIDALRKTSGDAAVQALVACVKAHCSESGDIGVRVRHERDEDSVRLVTEHRCKASGPWYWFGHCSMSKVAEFELNRFIKDHARELIAAGTAAGGIIEVYADGSIINLKED